MPPNPAQPDQNATKAPSHKKPLANNYLCVLASWWR